MTKSIKRKTVRKSKTRRRTKRRYQQKILGGNPEMFKPHVELFLKNRPKFYDDSHKQTFNKIILMLLAKYANINNLSKLGPLPALRQPPVEEKISSVLDAIAHNVDGIIETASELNALLNFILYALQFEIKS